MAARVPKPHEELRRIGGAGGRDSVPSSGLEGPGDSARITLVLNSLWRLLISVNRLMVAAFSRWVCMALCLFLSEAKLYTLFRSRRPSLSCTYAKIKLEPTVRRVRT